MIVIISGNPVPLAVAESVSIDDRIFERSTAQFNIVTEEHIRFKKGQGVVIKDDSNTEVLFEGYVDTSSERWIGDIPGLGANLEHSVQCTDQHYLADKRIVARAYEGQTAGAIVKDMVNGFLGNDPILGSFIVGGVETGEGVTIGSVSDGPIFIQCVFNYVTVARAIEALAEECDFWWTIRPDKKLYFSPRTAETAPITVISDIILGDSCTVTDGNSMYRNTQFIRGGQDVTDPQTEIQNGDGNKRAYTMAYPLEEAPTVAVSIAGGAFTSRTVGIGGVDTGKQWYWNRGEVVVFQDSSNTPLPLADRVRVTYRGQFEIIVKSMDQSQIVDRRLVEADETSGIVEDIADYMDITGRDAAFQIAGNLLGTYAKMGRTIQFETYADGFKPGQLLTADVPEHDINSEQFLIESVQINDY